jgi:hypothetical protein
MNQLLFNEQLALIRFTETIDPNEIVGLNRKLSMFTHLLDAHPYAHRPYRFPSAGKRLLRRPSKEQVAPLAAWENEGGAC